MESRNVDTHRAGHEAFNQRDFVAMTSQYAESITWTDHSQGRTFTTPQEFRADFLAGWVTASSDIKVTGPRYIDAGQTVVCTFTVVGTHNGPLGPFPATGEQFTLPLCEMWHFDSSGRVVGGDLYYDQVSLLMQLGLMPQPSPRSQLHKQNGNSTAVDYRTRPISHGNNRSDTGQEVAQKVFAAWERWDLQAVESFMADSAIDSRPQSGEHFVGRANIVAMYHEVPGPPKITWRSVRGGPKVWVGEGIVEYGEGPVHIVGIVEFADGKITMADYYFAEPFDPPASRSRWAAPRPIRAEAGEVHINTVPLLQG